MIVEVSLEGLGGLNATARNAVMYIVLADKVMMQVKNAGTEWVEVRNRNVLSRVSAEADVEGCSRCLDTHFLVHMDLSYTELRDALLAVSMHAASLCDPKHSHSSRLAAIATA